MSTRWVVGPTCRKVERAIQQHLKVGCRVADMNPHHTVVHLPTVAIPLTTCTHRLLAALGRSGLVHATNGLAVGMFFGDDLLASISELLFIPLDRFEKPLQCPRRSLELQGDRLSRSAVQIR